MTESALRIVLIGTALAASLPALAAVRRIGDPKRYGRAVLALGWLLLLWTSVGFTAAVGLSRAGLTLSLSTAVVLTTYFLAVSNINSLSRQSYARAIAGTDSVPPSCGAAAPHERSTALSRQRRGRTGPDWLRYTVPEGPVSEALRVGILRAVCLLVALSLVAVVYIVVVLPGQLTDTSILAPLLSPALAVFLLAVAAVQRRVAFSGVLDTQPSCDCYQAIDAMRPWIGEVTPVHRAVGHYRYRGLDWLVIPHREKGVRWLVLGSSTRQTPQQVRQFSRAEWVALVWFGVVQGL